MIKFDINTKWYKILKDEIKKNNQKRIQNK